VGTKEWNVSTQICVKNMIAKQKFLQRKMGLLGKN
jgi:hypothetical protein